jgi:hypothetical protein
LNKKELVSSITATLAVIVLDTIADTLPLGDSNSAVAEAGG